MRSPRTQPGSLCVDHGYEIARRAPAGRRRSRAAEEALAHATPFRDRLRLASWPARTSPARLVIALSVAAVLAVFLLYTSIAGGGTPAAPSELAGKAGHGRRSPGKVVGPVTGDAYEGGLRFEVRDIEDYRRR